MKTLNTQSKSMLDMIFENKNKQYGAYAIRATYNDTLVKSLALVATSLLLIIGSTIVYNKFFGEKPAEKLLLPTETITITPYTIDPIEKPIEKIEQSSSGPTSTAISTRIIDNGPDPIKPNPNLSLVTSIGDTSGVIDPAIKGTGPGTGTVTIVPVVPAVVTPISVAEIMPEFPGGVAALMTYLRNNIKYPQMELEAGIEGKVYVKFVVNADGTITNTEILKGVAGGEGLSKESIRVIKGMPKWKPGKQGNNFVPVYFNLPINFTSH